MQSFYPLDSQESTSILRTKQFSAVAVDAVGAFLNRTGS